MPKRIKTTLKPGGRDWIIFGYYLKQWMKNACFDQRQTAKWFGISVRRLQQYLQTTKPVWTGEGKRYICETPESFDFTTMDRLTRRRWTNKRSLTNEIARLMQGERRKRWTPKQEKIDPNLHMLIDEIRRKYQTKVVLNDNSFEFFHFGDSEQEWELLKMLAHGKKKPI